MLGIYIAASGGETTLYKNGAVVRWASRLFPNLPVGSYVLCCQPYMGGAAKLRVAEARRKQPPDNVKGV